MDDFKNCMNEFSFMQFFFLVGEIAMKKLTSIAYLKIN